MQNYEKLETPDYLFCEQPIKDNSIDADRMFIYCSRYLSLIEVWAFDRGNAAWSREQFQKNYTYKSNMHGSEDYLLVFVQNNVDLVNATKDSALDQIKTEDQVMDEAWRFFEQYLKWDDFQNI